MESQGRRLLILDDDVLNSEAMAKRLERRGFLVVHIADPNQLFEALERERSEVLLLDIVMPEADGISILKSVRSKYQKNELPVIMVTAVEDSLDVLEAFKLGANDYISKPVNVDVAIARINAHMSSVDLHRESLRKRELEAVRSMLNTLNHEINNPLAIAIGSLNSSTFRDEASLEKFRTALWRIANIVKKMTELMEKDVQR